MQRLSLEAAFTRFCAQQVFQHAQAICQPTRQRSHQPSKRRILSLELPINEACFQRSIVSTKDSMNDATTQRHNEARSYRTNQPTNGHNETPPKKGSAHTAKGSQSIKFDN